jgi:acetyl-CoA carboxylase/biotin carboxylase 1
LSIRLVASNPTGFVLKVDRYFEESDQITGKTVFRTLNSSNDFTIGNNTNHQSQVMLGLWDGKSTQTPYEVSQKFEKQRAEAMASSDTLYVYDWPALFENAVVKLWMDYKHSSHEKKSKYQVEILDYSLGEDYFNCVELVICDATTKTSLPKGWTAKQALDPSLSVLLPILREAGHNDCGMVAWLAQMKTPECPKGREIVIICNDITYQAGSFGTKEDAIFFKVK